MTKSKFSKPKSAAKPRQPKAKTDAAKTSAQIAAADGEAARAAGGDKSRPPKQYRSAKATGLTHKQKAALARHLMVRAGDLMELEDAQLGKEELVDVDRKLMGAQLAAWVSYLPGAYWDSRFHADTKCSR